MKRPAVLAVLLITAAAFAAADGGSLGGRLGYSVPSSQKIRNFEAWQALTPAEQKALRAQWKDLSSLPVARQDDIFRRHSALARMRHDHQRARGRPPTDDVLEAELAAFFPRVARALAANAAAATSADAGRDGTSVALSDSTSAAESDAPAATPAAAESDAPAADPQLAAAQADATVDPVLVERTLDERITRAVAAFLDNLESEHEIEAATRSWLVSLPPQELLVECLKLQKRRDIFLFVERHAPEGQAELMELSELSPLDAIDRLDDIRRENGFLGRAGQVLQLSPQQMAEISASPEEDALRLLKRMLAPRIRALLAAEGKPAERIDQILRLPPRELERVLNRLLRETR